MEDFVIFYISRVILYTLALTILLFKRQFWLSSVWLLCIIIATASLITRDEYITGILSNGLAFLAVITSLTIKRR